MVELVLIRGATSHAWYVLQALSILALNEEDADAFRTSRIYDLYTEVCRQEASDPLSMRRVRDLLKEHTFLDITEQSRHSNGSAGGI